MATYAGMTLGGEVRESVSLDDDDLSDVEDEVFIRDGKNGFKFAEDVGVKRPLMAPRKKTGRADVTLRIKHRPPCKALCMPCFCILLSLIVLIGLIVLVVIILMAFPLTLDNLRDWLLQEQSDQVILKSLPCNNLEVTDVWTVTLPKLTSESPIRLVDVNQDGIKDVIFGFGAGEDSNLLNSEVFCPVFLGVSFPCKGGVVALNGLDGGIIWRKWMNDTIFSIICTSDINDDNIMDCLVMGNEGTLSVLNSRNGSVIWQINGRQVDLYLGNFIPDQDNDTVDDILASHTILGSDEGHLILISGRNGKELQRVPVYKTFFIPQLIKKNNGSYSVLFGTGSPNTPGNLSIIALDDILNGSNTAQTLYHDPFAGILTQSVLVDINGDGHVDIIAALFNSTVVAIDGLTHIQIWNYSIPNTEMLIVPTPAYFNDDNITDFLIICQNPSDFDGNTLTKTYTYILDGQSGKPIYAKSIDGSVPTQMGALSLSMDGYGLDMFLFWTSECGNINERKNKIKFSKATDTQITSNTACANLNSSIILKLNALNQFDQPPGLEIYNSGNRSQLETSNFRSALEEIQSYLKQHPDKQFTAYDSKSVEIDQVIGNSNEKFRKYKNNFRKHQKDKNELFQVLNKSTNRYPFDVGSYDLHEQQNFETDYEQSPQSWDRKFSEHLLYGVDKDYNNYYDETDITDVFHHNQNRDPRSKAVIQDSANYLESSTQTTIQSNKFGIFDYDNVREAKKRLLHDLNSLPTDILRETYFENRKRQLKRSKFEQRDLKSHWDKIKENEEMKKVILQELKSSLNISENLWDLESEKEARDRKHGYWRSKRNIKFNVNKTNEVTSVAAIVDSLNVTNNSIDVIFLTYWIPTRNNPEYLLNQEFEKCVNKKLENDQPKKNQKTTPQEQTFLYMKECAEEFESVKRNFPYFNQVIDLSLGQMTVYRLRISCQCQTSKKNDRCAKFLPSAKQKWSQHLGISGNGMINGIPIK